MVCSMCFALVCEFERENKENINRKLLFLFRLLWICLLVVILVNKGSLLPSVFLIAGK